MVYILSICKCKYFYLYFCYWLKELIFKYYYIVSNEMSEQGKEIKFWQLLGLADCGTINILRVHEKCLSFKSNPCSLEAADWCRGVARRSITRELLLVCRWRKSLSVFTLWLMSLIGIPVTRCSGPSDGELRWGGNRDYSRPAARECVHVYMRQRPTPISLGFISTLPKYMYGGV